MSTLDDRDSTSTSKSDFEHSADKQQSNLEKEKLEKGRATPNPKLDLKPRGFFTSSIDKAIEQSRENKIKRIEKRAEKREPDQKLSLNFSRFNR